MYVQLSELFGYINGNFNGYFHGNLAGCQCACLVWVYLSVHGLPPFA